MTYLVEDDDNIRKLVSYALTKEGYMVRDFATPCEFWKEIENEEPSLIMLDIMLPQEDGLSILNRIRSDRRTEDFLEKLCPDLAAPHGRRRPLPRSSREKR